MESISTRQGEETEPRSAMVNSSSVRIKKEALTFAGGAHVGNEGVDVGAGDQQIRLGSASGEMMV